MDKVDKEYILIFLLDNLKIGISISITQRVIRALHFNSLPGAPAIVDGVINLEGNTIPVVNFRKRLNLKPKKVIPSDKLVTVKTDDISFSFFTDDVVGLKEIEQNNITKSSDMLPGTNQLIEGITIVEDEIILIHDVNKFLSLDEKNMLEEALSKTNN